MMYDREVWWRTENAVEKKRASQARQAAKCAVQCLEKDVLAVPRLRQTNVRLTYRA